MRFKFCQLADSSSTSQNVYVVLWSSTVLTVVQCRKYVCNHAEFKAFGAKVQKSTVSSRPGPKSLWSELSFTECFVNKVQVSV